MIVVADTSPLNYLVLIGSVDVLDPLYKQVVVPKSVADELRAPRAPVVVRSWIAQPPAWVEVRPDPALDPTLGFLDPGERAGLALAELLRADEVLIDERDGRTEATRRHLHVTGTVGVLADAHLAGLLDFGSGGGATPCHQPSAIRRGGTSRAPAPDRPWDGTVTVVRELMSTESRSVLPSALIELAGKPRRGFVIRR